MGARPRLLRRRQCRRVPPVRRPRRGVVRIVKLNPRRANGPWAYRRDSCGADGFAASRRGPPSAPLGRAYRLDPSQEANGRGRTAPLCGADGFAASRQPIVRANGSQYGLDPSQEANGRGRLAETPAAPTDSPRPAESPSAPMGRAYRLDPAQEANGRGRTGRAPAAPTDSPRPASAPSLRWAVRFARSGPRRPPTWRCPRRPSIRGALTVRPPVVRTSPTCPWRRLCGPGTAEAPADLPRPASAPPAPGQAGPTCPRAAAGHPGAALFPRRAPVSRPVSASSGPVCTPDPRPLLERPLRRHRLRPVLTAGSAGGARCVRPWDAVPVLQWAGDAGRRPVPFSGSGSSAVR